MSRQSEKLLDDEFEYSPELIAEIQRREGELDSGVEKPVPHDEAMRLMFENRKGSYSHDDAT